MIFFEVVKSIFLFQEADIAIGSLTVTSARERVIDFSSSFMDFSMAILMKRPKLHGHGYFQFFRPFSFGMWISVIVAVRCFNFYNTVICKIEFSVYRDSV